MSTAVTSFPERDNRVPARVDPMHAWDALHEVSPNAAHLARQKLVSFTRRGPAHVAVDMLRTRLLKALQANGWRRVALAAPTAGCGTSFVAANLAISLARGESRRVMLMDLDLRKPELAEIFGIQGSASMSEYLGGFVLPEQYFVRFGPNLALGLNTIVEAQAAEILLDETTGEVLRDMAETYQPDVIVYDLPPALEHDDLMAFLPHVDGVVMVVGGGVTRAAEVQAMSAMLEGQTQVLSIVLNQAEG